MAILNKQAGQRMLEVRERQGLTMRDVHRISKQIAKRLRNRDYVVAPSRLCDIEAKAGQVIHMEEFQHDPENLGGPFELIQIELKK